MKTPPNPIVFDFLGRTYLGAGVWREGQTYNLLNGFEMSARETDLNRKVTKGLPSVYA